MKTLLIPVCASVLTACASGPPGNDGQFALAARSWLGADVDDMIRVWGTPTSQTAAAPGENGLVHWSRMAYRGGAVDVSAAGYRCIVDAYSSVDGTINRIEVTSVDCDDRFADRLQLLSRP